MRKGIIYKATNLINGKIYIGQTTKKLDERKGNHISRSKKCKDFRTFQYALYTYGKKNFKWEIIYECDEVMLDMMETFKIMVNHSHYTENGYNLTWGGQSNRRGCKHTEETRKKISDVMKGKQISEETRQKIGKGNKGHSVSEETRKKISEGNKNKIVSEETRRKQSIALKGHSVSDEQIQKQKETWDKKRLEREANKIPDPPKPPKWLITYPDGSTIKIVNLSKFCKENGLIPQGLHNISRGNGHTYKGYKCEKIILDILDEI
jgi:group I intron endonuclease